MKRNWLSMTGLAIAAALFVVVNVLGNTVLRSVRADLTEDDLYTLSDGTRNVLRSLEEPIRLRLFFSKAVAGEYPNIVAYAERVRELLEDYVDEAGGELSLEVIDPEPFSPAEDQAVGYGLQAARINAAGDQLYFGLAGTNSVDNEVTIPFFDPRREEFLEYDLTELVYNLANFERRVAGVLSSLPLRGATQDPRRPPQPWAIVQQLEQLFEIRWLNDAIVGEEGIPEDVDVLVVVHPKNPTPEVLYAIDQYVLGGGEVLAFVDPFAMVDPGGPEAQQNPMMAQRDSDLGPLFSAWGVELVPGKLAADLEAAARVGWQDREIDFPAWINLGGDSLNREDFVTSGLNTVAVRYAGILEPLEGATTTFEPLLSTSAEAMAIDVTSVQFGPDPQRMLDTYVPGGEPLVIAARVDGPAETAFPDGRPRTPPPENGDEAEEEEEEEAEPDSLTRAEEIHVILVADVDLLHEEVWARVQNFLGSIMIYPVADNGDLIVNAIDNLSGSDDLIGLRSRGGFQRPFTKKIELEREADRRFRATEQELEAKLQETEQKLNELQTQKDDSSLLILSPEQEQALERFRAEQLETRKQLREVQHQLRQDIESLGTWLKIANILLVPALVLAAAIGVTYWRHQQRR